MTIQLNQLMMPVSTDSYKVTHFEQYPPGAQYISSYIEARGGEFKETVFAGLTPYIQDYLTQQVTMEQVDFANKLFTAHGIRFNYHGWKYIVEKHNGYLPISIEAVPEGTVVPVSNVLVQVINTDPMVPWLTSYVETSLLRAIWYSTTVATLSREIKKVIKRYLDLTSDDPEGELPFKLHDFAARGVSSRESAILGGSAHLMNFMGTDTAECLPLIMYYYGDEEVAGFSIPASEHSTITAWGKKREEDAYRNMIRALGTEGGIIACVSDSYDIWNALDIWGNSLKEEVENFGGTLVVRPDSGDPVAVPVECIERLMDTFGWKLNNKGFKVLPDCIRVIQGDGISIVEVKQICELLLKKGISISNIAFGMGGGLLQKVDRDTCEFAMKASAIYYDGEWHDVYKEPVGQSAKKSKRGILNLFQSPDGGFTTMSDKDLWDDGNLSSVHNCQQMLKKRYSNGEVFHRTTFAEIRQRAEVR